MGAIPREVFALGPSHSRRVLSPPAGGDVLELEATELPAASIHCATKAQANVGGVALGGRQAHAAPPSRSPGPSRLVALPTTSLGQGGRQ
eukprot:6612839-Pyramimonas_sp.AAC.1